MSNAVSNSPIPGPAPYSDEWYAIRVYNPDRKIPVVFGASEAAAACDVSPYKSALRLYLEKRGEAPPDERTAEEIDRLEIGRALEPAILQLYSDRTGLHVKSDLPMFHSVGNPVIAATPDGIASDGNGCRRLVDAKSSSFFMTDSTGENEHRYGEESDEVPLTAYWQAQQQLFVMGSKYNAVDFPVLFDNRKLKIYTVERDQRVIDSIVNNVLRLYEQIKTGNAPEPNYRSAETKALLHQMYRCEMGSVLESDDDDLRARAEEYKSLGLEIKRLDSTRKALGNLLTAKMQTAEFLRIAGCEFDVKRIPIAESIVTQRDVDDLQDRIGQTKRAGHSRLLLTKRKER